MIQETNDYEIGEECDPEDGDFGGNLCYSQDKLRDKQCTCYPGTYPSNERVIGGCVCPSGTTWDGTTKTCVSNNEENPKGMFRVPDSYKT